LILCQITSQAREDEYSIRLDGTGFVAGVLNLSSRIRPNRLFTAGAGIIVYRAGHLSQAKLDETVDRLITILRQG
jgi:mRNA interferase MazF